MNEVEIIQYSQVPGLKMFFNIINFRTMHQHPEIELIWVLDNPLVIRCSGNTYMVKPGDVFLFNQAELHEIYSISATTTFLCLQYDVEAMVNASLLRQIVFDDNQPFRHLTRSEIDDFRLRLLDIMRVYLNANEGFELYCTCHAGLLIHHLLQVVPHHSLTPHETSSQKKINARIQRLLDYVDENYMHKVTLSDFAAQENCSMNYLSHLIKGALNQSFQEYVTSRRLQAAIELIQKTSLRLIDISFESGFSDYRYFCAAFRARFNLSPEEYRRTYPSTAQDDDTVRKDKRNYGKSIENILNRSQSLLLLQKLCG